MMRVIGGNRVGRFSVEFEVVNYRDMALADGGFLPKDQVRRRTISGIVDPGAVTLVLPGSLVKELGLALGDTLKVRYADGRRARRPTAEAAYIELLGRHGTFMAIVEPKRDTALIGAMVLEGLDFLVDSKNQRLVPRDPTGQVFEIE